MQDEPSSRRPTTQPLRRSKEKVLGGVAGGIATFINADPRIIRVLFVITAFLSGGIIAGVYVLCWLLLPSA